MLYDDRTQSSEHIQDDILDKHRLEIREDSYILPYNTLHLPHMVMGCKDHLGLKNKHFIHKSVIISGKNNHNIILKK